MPNFLGIYLLFGLTAVAEIVGCYLPNLWLRHGRSPWLIVPAAGALGTFVWLLSLHPTTAAGRVYAAYGGVYVTTALLWLWFVEGVKPDVWDITGGTVVLLGVGIMVMAPRHI